MKKRIISLLLHSLIATHFVHASAVKTGGHVARKKKSRSSLSERTVLVNCLSNETSEALVAAFERNSSLVQPPVVKLTTEEIKGSYPFDMNELREMLYAAINESNPKVSMDNKFGL